MELDLDAWLPEPHVRTRHRRPLEPGRPALPCRGERKVLRRRRPRERWRIPGTAPELPFRELFRRYPFAVLAQRERWSVSGLCGRVWTLRRDYPRIEWADDFLAWKEPGTVRVLFAHWVEPEERARSALLSESRVQPVDRHARLRMRALLIAVGRF